MSRASATLEGGCLCGAVRFEIRRVLGPFELCHCPRCRKVSGSAFFAGLRVAAEGFRISRGASEIRDYEAPLLERPPAYRTSFCRICGSSVPHPRPGETSFEVPAGTLDTDPGVPVDRHIFVEHAVPWLVPGDDRPRLTKAEVAALRRGEEA